MTTITTTALPRTSHDPEEISPISSNPDPYALSQKLIPLSSLRQRGARRQIRKFYEDQNANIERLLKTVDDHRLDAAQEHEEKKLAVSLGKRKVLTR